MGQRLNIEIHKDGRCQLNCYFHWSAYTGESIKLTKDLLAYFDDEGSNLWNLTDIIVRFCKAIPGAGFPEDEIEKCKDEQLKSLISVYTNEERNCGLMAISEDGMEDNRYWEEGRVTLDLDTRTVDFEVYWEPSMFEDEEDRYSLFNVDLDVDVSCIPFSKFVGSLGRLDGSETFRDKTGRICISIY